MGMRICHLVTGTRDVAGACAAQTVMVASRTILQPVSMENVLILESAELKTNRVVAMSRMPVFGGITRIQMSLIGFG